MPDPRAVRIRRAVLDAIVAHARAAQPAECCGLLVGAAAAGVASVAIEAAVAARNLDDRPARFLIDPRDHIEARRDARRRGLDVIGFYHSHPHSPAEPSPADVAEAAYPDAVYVIVSLVAAVPTVRAFGIVDGAPVERPLVEED